MTTKKTQLMSPVGRLEDFGELNDLFTIRLRGIDYLLTKSLRSMVPEFENRTGTIAALALVVANPGISQREIVSRTMHDKSAMVVIMNRLEGLAWIARRSAQADRRRQEIFATSDGKAALSRIVASGKSVQSNLLRGISDEEMRQFTTMLDRFHKACISSFVAD